MHNFLEGTIQIHAFVEDVFISGVKLLHV